ncbi:hypothetical protein [Streptacidiphilus sp. MAP5-3]|uniref:hypothetical protein n=1 Tax=unclassified Streptacidiphilus TaxID=2643834 RepID=UPI003516A355
MTTTPLPRTRWSPARQRQALELSARYRHGETVGELATATGLSRSTAIPCPAGGWRRTGD